MAESGAAELRHEAGHRALPAPRLGRPWLLLVVVVAVLALFGLLYYGLRKGPNAPVGVAVPLNRPAPDFAVTTLDGRPLQLSSLRGKTVVVNVWGSYCLPCRDESVELNRSYALYKDRDVVFVGIAWNDDDGEARKFVERYRVPYPIALDPEGRIAIDLGITGVPETFVIDPTGRLTQKWIGPVTSAQLNALLAPLVR